MLAYVLLGFVEAAGVVLLPFVPLVIWVQLGALAAFGWRDGFQSVDEIPLVILLVLAVSTELARLVVRKGNAEVGKRRNRLAGTLIGGAAGALASLLFPLIGVLFGSLIGSLIASLIASFPLRRDGIGAFLGETLALSLRSTTAISIAVIALFTAFI